MNLKETLHAAVFGCFVGAVGIEQILWDGRDMETPTENTVTAFEVEEHGLSVVLTNAIEDQKAVVEYLTAEHDRLGRLYVTFAAEKAGCVCRRVAADVNKAAERQFQAMRVLGLLEATREREAGRVA